MRYQKWGKNLKIVCYSQQTTKQYLIKDPDCKNQKYFAEDVEEAVVQELFQMSYLNNKNTKKTVSQFEVLDNLKLKIRRKQEEIKRLYNIYAEKGTEQLLEVISEREQEIDRLQEAALNESKKSTIAIKIEHSREILRDLQKSWGVMSIEEKKHVCDQLIDKIIISGASGSPSITVKFKLQEYLLEDAK